MAEFVAELPQQEQGSGAAEAKLITGILPVLRRFSSGYRSGVKGGGLSAWRRRQSIEWLARKTS